MLDENQFDVLEKHVASRFSDEETSMKQAANNKHNCFSATGLRDIMAQKIEVHNYRRVDIKSFISFVQKRQAYINLMV
jgi:hypothetical protein